MTILVFDLDDTLLMSGTYKRYSDIEPDHYLNFLLFKLNSKNLYIQMEHMDTHMIH